MGMDREWMVTVLFLPLDDPCRTEQFGDSKFGSPEHAKKYNM